MKHPYTSELLLIVALPSSTFPSYLFNFLAFHNRNWLPFSSNFSFLSAGSHSEEDSLVAMLRFQEFERSTVDTEGAMGLAAILAGQLPELRGKRWVTFVHVMLPMSLMWKSTSLISVWWGQRWVKFSWSYVQMNQQVNTVKILYIILNVEPLRAEMVFLADNLAL